MQEDLSLRIPGSSLSEGDMNEGPSRDKSLFGCFPLGNCRGPW